MFRNKIVPKSTSSLLENYKIDAQKVPTPYDLRATLLCKKISEGSLGHWSLSLTELDGDKMSYLLGLGIAETDTLPLEKLIPAEAQARHATYIDTILNEGKGSAYWDLLFNGMMRRTIKIMTAQKQPRFVKISMVLDEQRSIDRELYVFNVTLFDETAPNAIAEKAARITHDARGLIIASNVSEPLDNLSLARFLTLSQSELTIIYQQHQQATKQRKEILDACLDLFKPSRSDFTSDAIIKDAVELDVRYETQMLQEVITYLNRIYTKRQGQTIRYSGSVDTFLEKRQIEALKCFLLNLIKNSIEAEAREICIRFEEKDENLLCDVSDDGKGMSEELAQNFFSRDLPINRTEKNNIPVTANRHEGTLLAFKLWEDLGGSAKVSSRYNPTIFQLAIPLPLKNQERSLAFVEKLTSSQKAQLDNFFSSNELKHTILLVDDSPTQLKVIKRIIHEWNNAPQNNVSHVLQNITDWQAEGFRMDNINQCGIIYVANGELALKIIKQGYPIAAVITDQNMPGISGLELLADIVQYLKARNDEPVMELALHTSDQKSELSIEERNLFSELQATCLPKANKEQFMAFLGKVKRSIGEAQRVTVSV